MPPLLLILKDALQQELPHSSIENEDISSLLKQGLIQANRAIKAGKMQPPPRPCAVLLAFYQQDGEWFLPLIIRPERSRTHAGQIAFPGGKMEETDQDLTQTAIRETVEEIGVTTDRTQIIGSLSKIYIPPSNAIVTPIIGFLKEIPLFTPNPEEVDEVLCIRLKDLTNPVNKTVKKIPLPDNEILEMPAYQIGKHLIWGGTARMIDELNKIL